VYKEELLGLWLLALALEMIGLATLTIVLWQGYSGILLWLVVILVAVKAFVQLRAIDKLGK